MSLKVGIISGGAFGTAIAVSIADELKAVKGYNDTLTILVRDESFNGVKVVDLFNKYKENKMYLPNVNLKENIKATTDFNEVMDWDIVFFATPQEHFISLCDKIKVKKTALLISLTKGLLDNKLTTPCSFLKKKYNTSVFALMGANLASEIAENQPTQSTLGYAPEDKELAHKIIKPLFKNIKIEPFPSFLGVEYCGTFKNVVATIYGVALGLNLGGNLRSAIFSQGIKELKHFLSLHSLGEDLIFYSCGIQDLFVTCLHGRNKDCGYKIGISHDIKDYTCQGINSCYFYYEYLESTGKINEFPLVKLLYMIITKKEKDFKKAICELFE